MFYAIITLFLLLISLFHSNESILITAGLFSIASAISDLKNEEVKKDEI